MNGFDNVYIERAGKLVETNIRFRDQAHLRMIIDRIVSNVGRRIDDSSPIVDARLERRLARLRRDSAAVADRPGDLDPALRQEAALHRRSAARTKRSRPACSISCAACVEARLNILIAGGSGSGKTTLLNTLSRFIPEEERVVTIEDTAELQLQQPHVVRLETRPMNIEGAGAITQRDLVINALRMRPDRIIVGECRGAEAFDMMQAMNTGHDGSMTTTHANSARDAFSRLETMVMMVSQNVPDVVIRQMLASAIQLVVHCARLSDGTRKITAISEVTGVEDDQVAMQDIFSAGAHGRRSRAAAVLGTLRRHRRTAGFPRPFEGLRRAPCLRLFFRKRRN